MSKSPIQSRFLRAHQAPSYLGMCRGVFNKTVRPHVRGFPGERGIEFDRIELDQWVGAHIATHSVAERAKTEPTESSSGNFTHSPKTSEEFHRLVADILGKKTKDD